MSYQEKINSLPNLQQKILFEMSHNSKNTVQKMKLFSDDKRLFKTFHYESLIGDPTFNTFIKFFKACDFNGESLVIALEACYKGHLFLNPDRIKKKGAHISNGKGSQWYSLLDLQTRSTMNEYYADAIIQLGYQLDRPYELLKQGSTNPLTDLDIQYIKAESERSKSEKDHYIKLLEELIPSGINKTRTQNIEMFPLV